MTSLTLFSPSGYVSKPAVLRRGVRRLQSLGFEVQVDEAALARHQRFAGDDEMRLAALHRVADAAPSVAMATRGGYGLTRLLDRIDWPRLARSVERGTRWVGYSDVTALHLGLLAHGRVPSWAGPTVGDFGASEPDDVTIPCFLEAMGGDLEALGWKTAPGFDGLQASGTLWGGNLTLVCSMLGTPHWPKVRGGILFLEDVNEHPYRIERCLLQLQQAGVIDAQKAVLLGHFNGWEPASNDRGYTLKSAVQALTQVTRTPVLSGLPFGHVPTRVILPVGQRVRLAVQGRDVFMGW